MKMIDDLLLLVVPKLPYVPQSLIDYTYRIAQQRIQETQAEIIRLKWDKAAADKTLNNIKKVD